VEQRQDGVLFSAPLWAPPRAGIGSTAGRRLFELNAEPLSVSRFKLLFNEFKPVDTAHGALVIPKEQACHCVRPVFEPRRLPCKNAAETRHCQVGRREMPPVDKL
jgi:hypothetical protein